MVSDAEKGFAVSAPATRPPADGALPGPLAIFGQMNMPRRPRHLILPLLIAATLTLSACKTSEEKAEDYYQSGLALLAKGDEDRAMIEFRNVFKYNGLHKAARRTYADTLVKEGKQQEAYSQYLRLIEQYPDTVDVRVILAEIAIDTGAWEEAERHGRAAIALAPDAPDVRAIKAALDFRAAVLANDTTAQNTVAAQAAALMTTLPENKIIRRIVIGNLTTGPDPLRAIPIIDDGLKLDPKSLELYWIKFRILAKAEDVKGTGDTLKRMVELFPDNVEVTSALIGWYMLQKDFDGAEAFLRKRAGPPDGPTDVHLALLQFLQQARGADAARAELDVLLAANQGNANAELYGGMRASMDFEEGKPDAAVGALQVIVKTAAASDQTRNLKVILAHMLDTTANRVGARALVEEVLAEDPSNLAALKLRAAWFIADDKPGDAIVDLRSALDQSPRDIEVLTMTAAAYERDGNLDLAGDQLAKAVEMSGAAPAESLRYAQFLMQLGKVQVVATVLANAQQASPYNPDILRAQAQYYIGQREWVFAEAAIDALRALGLKDTEAEIQQMQAAVLNGQNRVDESLALLQAAAAQGGQTNSAVLAIVQAQVQAGKTAEALAYVDGLLAKSPQDRVLRLLGANLDQLVGKTAEAEASYRQLISEDPKDAGPIKRLYDLLQTAGRDADAAAVLAAGIAAVPQSHDLLWAKAAQLEKDGKIDGAISVYDALYAENSSDTIVANNLASLITAHHDDAGSLTRAEAIARRLRGLDVPAFQDTYGWIAFRRGNLDEALSHLEPAAKGLPKDALTQFHLAMLYDKLGRSADAIRQFDLALTLAGDKVPPPMAAAQARLDQLKAAAQGTTSP